MKTQEAKSLKINPILHKALKSYCVEVETPLRDFVDTILNSALPPDRRVKVVTAKKKAK